VLYSVGPNGINDGGPIGALGVDGTNIDRGDDIGIQVPERADEDDE
jgi:hypothetical protein